MFGNSCTLTASREILQTIAGANVGRISGRIASSFRFSYWEFLFLSICSGYILSSIIVTALVSLTIQTAEQGP